VSSVEREDMLDSLTLGKMSQACISEVNVLVMKPGQHILNAGDVVLGKRK